MNIRFNKNIEFKGNFINDNMNGEGIFKYNKEGI